MRLLVFFLLLPFFATAQQESEVDSLRQRLELTVSPIDRITLLHNLAQKLYQQDYWLAITYAQQALELSDRENLLPSKIKSLSLMGLVLRQMGNYAEAVQYLDEGLLLNEGLNDMALQLELLRNKGNALQIDGELEGAISAYYDGLDLAREEGADTWLNTFYTALAQVKWQQEDTVAARNYYEEAIAGLQDAPDRRKGSVLYNYAIFLARMKLYEEALARLKDVLPYFSEPAQARNQAITLGAIGDVYSDMKDYPKAREFMHKSLAEKKKIGIPESTAYAYHSLGDLMDSLNLQDSALFFYNAGLGLAESQSDDPVLKRDLHKSLAGTLQKMGRSAEALQHFRAYMALEEELWKEIDRATTTEIEKKYNFGKQVGENASLRIENELNSVRLSRQKIQLFAVLGLLASSIAIAFLLIRQGKRKRLMAQTIADHQATLHQERMQRLKQESENRAINAMMDGQEQERHRIAEALHSSMGSLLSAIQMHFQTIREKAEIEKEPLLVKTGTLIDEACQSNRRIAHELLPPVLMKLGLEPAIQQLAEKLRSPGIEVETSFYGMNKRLPDKLELTIYRAVDELLNNIMKHAGANHISIQLTEHEDELNILVEDNGKGFSYDSTNPDYGLGLTNMASRVRHFEGSFDIDSTPGSGTTVIINIPLSTDPNQTDAPISNGQRHRPKAD